jgi:hypothetical protein
MIICRGATRFVGMEPVGVAKRVPAGIVTIHQLEAAVSEPRHATVDVIRRAFESAGVEFIDENGGARNSKRRGSGLSPFGVF